MLTVGKKKNTAILLHIRIKGFETKGEMIELPKYIKVVVIAAVLG